VVIRVPESGSSQACAHCRQRLKFASRRQLRTPVPGKDKGTVQEAIQRQKAALGVVDPTAPDLTSISTSTASSSSSSSSSSRQRRTRRQGVYQGTYREDSNDDEAATKAKPWSPFQEFECGDVSQHTQEVFAMLVSQVRLGASSGQERCRIAPRVSKKQFIGQHTLARTFLLANVVRRLKLQKEDALSPIPPVLHRHLAIYPSLQAMWPLPVLVSFVGPTHGIIRQYFGNPQDWADVLSDEPTVANQAAERVLTNRRDGLSRRRFVSPCWWWTWSWWTWSWWSCCPWWWWWWWSSRSSSW